MPKVAREKPGKLTGAELARKRWGDKPAPETVSIKISVAAREHLRSRKVDNVTRTVSAAIIDHV